MVVKQKEREKIEIPGFVCIEGLYIMGTQVKSEKTYNEEWCKQDEFYIVCVYGKTYLGYICEKTTKEIRRLQDNNFLNENENTGIRKDLVDGISLMATSIVKRMSDPNWEPE